MTSIAHRVEEDIRSLAERMGLSMPQQLPPAAMGGAGTRSSILSNHGLDLELLHRLADSESFNTLGSEQDDSGTYDDSEAANDAAVTDNLHSAAAIKVSGSSSDLLQPCKRHKGEGSVTGPAACMDGDVITASMPPKAAQQAQHQQVKQQSPCDQQHAQQLSVQAGANAAGTADASASHQQAAPSTHPAPVPVQCVVAVPTAAHTCQQLMSMGNGCVPADAAVHDHDVTSDDDDCAGDGVGVVLRQGSIMRQTQVALTTWEHLKTSSSTPSTVIATHNTARSNTVMSESSVA